MNEYADRRQKLFDMRDHPGGWSRERLAEMGVPWPAPLGWADQIILHGFPYNPSGTNLLKKAD